MNTALLPEIFNEKNQGSKEYNVTNYHHLTFEFSFDLTHFEKTCPGSNYILLTVIIITTCWYTNMVFFSFKSQFNLLLFVFCSERSGWGSWGSWSLSTTCSSTCGQGSQTYTRTRRCTNPSPEKGGKDCIGQSAEYKNNSCFITQCPGMRMFNFLIHLLSRKWF